MDRLILRNDLVRESTKIESQSPARVARKRCYLFSAGVQTRAKHDEGSRKGGKPLTLHCSLPRLRRQVRWTVGPQVYMTTQAAATKGLEGVVAANTRLSDVKGDIGELIYCGYNINELAGKVSYEEVVHLLHHN